MIDILEGQFDQIEQLGDGKVAQVAPQCHDGPRTMSGMGVGISEIIIHGRF